MVSVVVLVRRRRIARRGKVAIGTNFPKSDNDDDEEDSDDDDDDDDKDDSNNINNNKTKEDNEEEVTTTIIRDIHEFDEEVPSQAKAVVEPPPLPQQQPEVKSLQQQQQYHHQYDNSIKRYSVNEEEEEEEENDDSGGDGTNITFTTDIQRDDDRHDDDVVEKKVIPIKTRSNLNDDNADNCNCTTTTTTTTTTTNINTATEEDEKDEDRKQCNNDDDVVDEANEDERNYFDDSCAVGGGDNDDDDNDDDDDGNDCSDCHDCDYDDNNNVDCRLQSGNGLSSLDDENNNDGIVLVAMAKEDKKETTNAIRDNIDNNNRKEVTNKSYDAIDEYEYDDDDDDQSLVDIFAAAMSTSYTYSDDRNMTAAVSAVPSSSSSSPSSSSLILASSTDSTTVPKHNILKHTASDPVIGTTLVKGNSFNENTIIEIPESRLSGKEDTYGDDYNDHDAGGELMDIFTAVAKMSSSSATTTTGGTSSYVPDTIPSSSSPPSSSSSPSSAGAGLDGSESMIVQNLSSLPSSGGNDQEINQKIKEKTVAVKAKDCLSPNPTTAMEEKASANLPSLALGRLNQAYLDTTRKLPDIEEEATTGSSRANVAAKTTTRNDEDVAELLRKGTGSFQTSPTAGGGVLDQTVGVYPNLYSFSNVQETAPAACFQSLPGNVVVFPFLPRPVPRQPLYVAQKVQQQCPTSNVSPSASIPCKRSSPGISLSLHDGSTKKIARTATWSSPKGTTSIYKQSNAYNKRHGQRFLQSQAETWTVRLHEAAQFRKQHGHCRIPAVYKPNQNLAAWAKRQRHQYKLYMQLGDQRSSLTAARIEALERIEFCWDNRESSWFLYFDQFKEFLAIHGTAPTPSSCANGKLYNWVKVQRRELKLWKEGKPSLMNAERVTLLESIGLDPLLRHRARMLDTSIPRTKRIERTHSQHPNSDSGNRIGEAQNSGERKQSLYASSILSRAKGNGLVSRGASEEHEATLVASLSTETKKNDTSCSFIAPTKGNFGHDLAINRSQ